MPQKVACVNIYSMLNKKNLCYNPFLLVFMLNIFDETLVGTKKAVHGGLSVQRKYLDMRQSR